MPLRTQCKPKKPPALISSQRLGVEASLLVAAAPHAAALRVAVALQLWSEGGASGRARARTMPSQEPGDHLPSPEGWRTWWQAPSPSWST